jgi:hypothetical protein
MQLADDIGTHVSQPSRPWPGRPAPDIAVQCWHKRALVPHPKARPRRIAYSAPALPGNGPAESRRLSSFMNGVFEKTLHEAARSLGFCFSAFARAASSSA